jgi:hypothetical protein
MPLAILYEVSVMEEERERKQMPLAKKATSNAPLHKAKKTKLRGLSPQANYYRPSDRRLTAKLVPPLRVEGVAWSAQRIPTAVNLGFLTRSRYFFIQVAPQMFTWRG